MKNVFCSRMKCPVISIEARTSVRCSSPPFHPLPSPPTHFLLWRLRIKMNHKFWTMKASRSNNPPTPRWICYNHLRPRPPFGALAGTRRFSSSLRGMFEVRTLWWSYAEKNSPLIHRTRENCVMQCVAMRNAENQHGAHVS